MVRTDLMKSVIETLGSHPYLAVEDFSLDEYKNNNNKPCLRIYYRHNPSWEFKFFIPDRPVKGEYTPRYVFDCTASPGLESFTEEIEASNRTGLMSAIKEWLGRLYKDIVAAPIIRQFDEYATTLKDLQERLKTLPDEPLTKDDIGRFEEGLRNIKKEVMEQLAKTIKDKDELAERVHELSRDIDFLKQTLNSMTRRQWADIFSVRITKWRERFGVKQIAAGARIAQALMPDSSAGQGVADFVNELSDIIDSADKQSGAV